MRKRDGMGSQTNSRRGRENHMSTRGSTGVKVNDLNRDEVGIPIFVEITHDTNNNNNVPNVKGLKW